jgi:hypothetical protein
MIVSNDGYTLAQANLRFLDLLNEGNTTLTNLDKVGQNCCVAKKACADAQRIHTRELAELTERVQKLHAILQQLIDER